MSMPVKKPSWTIADLIDLEFFMHQDDQRPEGPEKEGFHKQERRHFIDSIEPALTGHTETEQDKNKAIIRHWLDYRRSLENPESRVLPGDIYKQTFAFSVLLFIIIGFSSGSGLAFSFLLYKGHMPLNVASYLGIFVLTQVVLLLFVFLLLMFRSFNITFNHFSLIRYGVYTLLTRLILWIKKRSEGKMPPEKKLAFQSALGVIRGKSRHYMEIFPWPLFALTQVFAVFFNIGILTATLLRVIGSDLAFGWQSTLQLSSIAVLKAVTFVSLPWSWIVPESLAHPSLAQIEGSRIVLKDGMAFLSTPDLTAWWPFLCFAVLAYGLLPRLVLLTACVFMEKSAMKRLRFQSISWDKMLRRLTSPYLDTHGENSEVSQDYSHLAPYQSPAKAHEPGKPLLVLVPEDIVGMCHEDKLSVYIKKLLGAGLSRIEPVSLHMDDDKQVIQSLLSENQGRIVLLLESWQAPIREIIDYIQTIISMGGPDFMLYILFVGRPSHNSMFTPSQDHELLIWKQKINALGSSNISIEVIPPHPSSTQIGNTHHD